MRLQYGTVPSIESNGLHIVGAAVQFSPPAFATDLSLHGMQPDLSPRQTAGRRMQLFRRVRLTGGYILPMIRTPAWYRKLDWWLVAILAVALAIRVFYLIHYHSLPDWSLLKMDHWYHHHWAQSLAGGNILGDTTFFRAPLYVYCLGALYAIFGDSLWVGRLFGMAIGLVTILFVYLIGTRVFGRTTGRIAAALQAVYPVNVFFEGELLLDPLFTLLLLVAFHRFLIWRAKTTAQNLALTGFCLGLAAITRPTALVLAALLIVWLLASRTNIKARIVSALVVVCGLAIVILPISIRNVVVANDPVLIASQGGINLYIGNNDAADGTSSIMPEPFGHTWRIRDVIHIAESAEGRPLKPGELSSYWQGRAIDWTLANPLDAAGLYARKLWLSIGNREISNNRNMGAFFSSVPYLQYFPFGFALIFGLAVVGAAIAWRSRFETRAMVAAIACILLVNAAFFVNSRFRQPIIPLLILLAGAAVVYLFDMRRPRKAVFRAVAIGLFACVVSWFPIDFLTPGVNIQPSLSRALSAYANGDTWESLAYARQAERLNDSFPEVNLTIGVCYFRLQQPDSARYYFNREIALHPDRPKAYSNLGSLYLVNGQYAESRQLLEKARSLQPYDEIAGMLWIRAHARDSAISNAQVQEAVRSVLATVAEDPIVVHEAAAALVQRGLLSDAAGILNRGLGIRRPPIETDDFAFERDFPNSPDRFARRMARLSSLLGYVCGLQQDFEGAIRASRAAIAQDPLNPDPYINLASGYMSLGDFAQADSVLQSATLRFPDNSQITDLRARFRK